MIRTRGAEFPCTFVFEPCLKGRVRFDAGVFVDEQAFSRRIFDYPRSRRIALLQETPIKGLVDAGGDLARHFDLVLTFDRDLVAGGTPFVQFPYPRSVSLLGMHGECAARLLFHGEAG